MWHSGKVRMNWDVVNTEMDSHPAITYCSADLQVSCGLIDNSWASPKTSHHISSTDYSLLPPPPHLPTAETATHPPALLLQPTVLFTGDSHHHPLTIYNQFTGTHHHHPKAYDTGSLATPHHHYSTTGSLNGKS